MRILLVTGEHPLARELAHLLEGEGHDLTQLAAGGENLLPGVKQGPRFHAAVLEQSMLGKRWPWHLRQLRRRAPHLPAVVLLAPGGGPAWRRAILAGAFEAIPVRSSLEVTLEALSRALKYSTGC